MLQITSAERHNTTWAPLESPVEPPCSWKKLGFNAYKIKKYISYFCAGNFLRFWNKWLFWIPRVLFYQKIPFKVNRHFSKMAAEISNKLELAKIKIVYQHLKEHLCFRNPAKFQHFRCNISWENVSWKLKNLQTFVRLGVCHIPPVIQTSLNFSIFNLYQFSLVILHLKCWNFAGLLK